MWIPLCISLSTNEAVQGTSVATYTSSIQTQLSQLMKTSCLTPIALTNSVALVLMMLIIYINLCCLYFFYFFYINPLN